jgi:SAM-dependent methyltransferase
MRRLAGAAISGRRPFAGSISLPYRVAFAGSTSSRRRRRRPTTDEDETMIDRSPAVWLDRSRATWDERAADWDACSETNAAAADRPADLERTAAALALRPGARLLDAGCGTGQFALAFAARGLEVVGVDLSPAMLARARRHGAEVGLSVEWRESDLTRLGDAAATYDAVHARVSLQFVPDPVVALREFRRVLKPDGRLYASVPGALSPIYGRSWRRFVEPEAVAANFLTPWELETLLDQLGWEVTDGWGSFGANMSGDTNAFTAASVAHLDRRLQQAAATIWAIVARLKDQESWAESRT